MSRTASFQLRTPEETERWVQEMVTADMWESLLRKNPTMARFKPVRKLFHEEWVTYGVCILAMEVRRAYEGHLTEMVFVGLKGPGVFIAERAASFFYAATRIEAPVGVLDTQAPNQDLLQFVPVRSGAIVPGFVGGLAGLVGKTVIVWSDLYQDTVIHAAYKMLTETGAREVAFVVLVDKLGRVQPEGFHPLIFRGARVNAWVKIEPDEIVMVLFEELGDGETSVWLIKAG